LCSLFKCLLFFFLSPITSSYLFPPSPLPSVATPFSLDFLHRVAVMIAIQITAGYASLFICTPRFLFFFFPSRGPRPVSWGTPEMDDSRFLTSPGPPSLLSGIMRPDLKKEDGSIFDAFSISPLSSRFPNAIRGEKVQPPGPTPLLKPGPKTA